MPSALISSRVHALIVILLCFAVFAEPGLGQRAQIAVEDTVRAGRFDSGRMWTFDFPPVDYLREAYDFAPDDAWFERARLGALRIPGCTASFVSSSALVMTNHHCGRGHVSTVTRSGENLLDDGFYASSLSEERAVDGMYADQLVAIEDVTDEIYAALEGAETDAERADARREAIESVQNRILQEAGGEDAGFFVQVISLYNAARYSAYTFRRYQDVRLVMAPELQLGYFGGDADNFTYPRYSLDMTFFRVYEDGQPLQTENYFPWSDAGADEGELVFVVGNPGSTNRLETVAQLEYRRDVQERFLLDWVDRRVEALAEYVEDDPSDAVRNQLFSLLNAQKLYRGRVEGLNDPVLMARRSDTERQFREAIQQDAALQAEYGDLIDEMSELQQERQDAAAQYNAFLGLAPTSTLGSTVMRRAMLAARLVAQREAGADENQLSRLRDQILAIADQPEALQQAYAEDRVAAFQQSLADLAPELSSYLSGRDPASVAAEIVSQSALVDSSSAVAALESGTISSDPAVQLAQTVGELYADFQSASSALGAREQELASRLGRARFEIYGTEIPPDATFSLRIADGVVQGFPYNGTIAPPHTTFYGLYDRFYSFGPGTEWDLPARWQNPPAELDLETPYNLVSTNDIIGGNSGSPLLNDNLEVVGLVFDGNIQSLPSSFIYVTEAARAVSVDSRGMIEALEAVYEADRIVEELRSGVLAGATN